MIASWKWLLAVVIAALLGFLSGKGTTENEDESIQSEVDVKERYGRSNSSQARASRRLHQGSRSELKNAKFDKMLAEMNAYSEIDVFGVENGSSFARMCGLVMNLPRGEFPGVMARIKEAGTANQEKFRNLLLRRWVEFDPDAAMSWVEGQKDEADEAESLSLQFFVLQEAVIDHPAWAVERLKSWSGLVEALNKKAGEEGGVDDPFGDHYVSYDMDLFCLRLALLPEQQREALRKSMGEKWFAEGTGGWARGIAAHSNPDQVQALSTEYLAKKQYAGLRESLELLAKRDWKLVKQWADSHDSDDAENVVFKSWSKEDPSAAALWYINRSDDARERHGRLGTVASNIKDDEARRNWIASMEAQGEDVSGPWSDYIQLKSRAGELEEAASLLSKVPDSDRQELLVGIYQRASNLIWFKDEEGGSMQIVSANPSHSDFLASLPGYQDYLLDQNATALEHIKRYIETANASISRKASPDDK
ncbi:hypothetical protein NT6N_34540 [Oceaniferula spumae]|uniref:DUF4034 domain-containing protein n=1 Tax=Oceaniferula spumae TaxID=2979115 RepID=A0AAT9FR83_9BACT